MIDMILGALWFFLPAGIGNAVPVVAAKLPWLRSFNTPMDFGKTYKGIRLFGANKTWRGLFAGIIMATVVIALQKYLYTRSDFFFDVSWIDYRPGSIWLLGPLLSIGALLADALESFLKRQRDIAPGHPWFPFDQIDYIVGGCLLSLPLVQLSLSQYTWILGVWFGMHIVVVYVFYLLGIRERPI